MHRRHHDPYAPCDPAELAPDCEACRSGEPHDEHEGAAVEPQEAPAGDDGQTPAPEPEGQEEPQEAPEPAVQEPAPEQVAEEDVPDNAEDVVAWVGRDRGRARAALAKEAKRPKERKTVAALRALLEE